LKALSYEPKPVVVVELNPEAFRERKATGYGFMLENLVERHANTNNVRSTAMRQRINVDAINALRPVRRLEARPMEAHQVLLVATDDMRRELNQVVAPVHGRSGQSYNRPGKSRKSVKMVAAVLVMIGSWGVDCIDKLEHDAGGCMARHSVLDRRVPVESAYCGTVHIVGCVRSGRVETLPRHHQPIGKLAYLLQHGVSRKRWISRVDVVKGFELPFVRRHALEAPSAFYMKSVTKSALKLL
jgi:hypothetical protein